ncbi:MAG: amino acid adenylation domain-containing protein, partial [Bifidobacteriaceae bacterium]|nr:amino acid adenylation domain-containing protein [Bifidobacteriaceae bacterium]
MSTTVVDALARVIQTKTGAVADASERLASAIPNSLAFMEVIAQCEDEFGVLIDPARLTRATTVGQFAEIVETARSAGCRRLEPPPAPGPAAGSPAAATGPGRATTRVGMNPMQVAYLLGANEGVELGGQATLIYFEARLPCSAATAAKAVERLFARHEVFRAQIDHDNAELVVSPDAATRPVVAHEPDPAGADGLASSIRRRLIEEAKRSTDGPWLYGAEVIGLSDGDSRLCFFLNMIIMDAASAFILVRELAGLAKGAELDEPKSLAAATAEIARHKSPASRRRDHDYWRQAAPSLPPAPRFKPGVAVYDGWSTQRVSATLPPHLTRALERRARSDAVSVSSVLLAIHGAVVARWANSPRFTVNVTLTERGAIRRPQSALGDFTSSTLVGLDLAAAESFEDLAAAVQRDIAAGLAHRSYTGVEVIQTVLRTQANRRQAIMPVVFTSFLNGSGRDAPAGAGADGACDDAAVAAGVAVDYTYTQTSQVFLDMQAMSYGETIAVSWDYVPEYFGFPVASAFDAMIQAVTAYANGQTPLPITDAATERAVAAYNQTSAELPSGTLTSALLESFDRHANRVALVSHAHGLTYTYADLRRRSAQLAHALVAAGCRPGDVVVVESTKHPASVINQLAALRAGCAFAPLNAAYPRQRKDDIGRMAGAKIAALTDASFRELSAERHPDTFPDVETAPESLAYVIFTSGSTGRPKGVEISHAGAWNTIADINSRFQVGPEDVIVGLSALSFDLSIYDIYGAFAAGATLALVDDQRDADEIHSVLAASRATIWNSTPALVELALLRSGPATAYPWLRLLMMSGDRIAHDLPGRASAIFPRCQVYSLGGATEGSIWSIYYRLGGPPDPTRIPYGYPLANQQIYVLGYDGRLCPAAVAGEICIGGRGVAVGYRGEPDKTAAAFVASGAYGRLYRTGDVGVFNREGYVDFLGRQDRQIKIRGHRVELGEIEAVLTGDKRVARAQAAVLQRRGHDVLVAFVVPEAAAASVDPNGLIARAREYLPDYMAPGRVVVVQEIPVTAHGKVDLVALQGLFDQDESGDERPSAATAATAATADPAGAAMRELWGRVLDAPVAADDASFFELGGDSLRFQDLLRLVRRETGRSLRFRDVIANPTVRQMTALLDRAPTVPADSAPAADSSHSPGAAGAPDARDSPDAAQAAGSGPYDPFPLTDMQRAYLVGRSTAFALGGVAEHYYVESENTVDLPRLEEAFNALIARHPMLHAVIGDDGTQRVLERVPRYRIAVRDLSGLSQAEADREIEKRRAELGHQVLEPGVWPQFEFSAFALGGGRHRLFFSVDMILADGASQRILLEDLTRLYDAAEPLPIRGAFRDYVLRFQRERPGAFGTLSPDRLDEIADAFPVGNFLPELPGADQSARPVIRRLSHNLSADQAAKLRRQAARAGVSVSALFCAAYVSSLGLWATAPRVGVNVTTYNRDRRFGEVEGVVGDFTGVVLLSYDAGPAEDVFGLARRVQRDLLEHLEAEYSGVAMVSEIARRRGSIGQATAPFVFTSLLFDGREPAMRGRDASVFGRICHALSQTP